MGTLALTPNFKTKARHELNAPPASLLVQNVSALLRICVYDDVTYDDVTYDDVTYVYASMSMAFHAWNALFV